MTARTREALTATLALCMVSATAAASAQTPGLLTDVIDPYNPGKQRSLFFKAAGVDTELDAEEFRALADKTATFRQPYDQWDTMLPFDSNASKSLDWFEADAYRKTVRAAVIKQFDANSDGKLAGDERKAASAALARGKLPKLEGDAKAAALAQAGNADEYRQRWKKMRAEYDADGDGKLNDEERQAMRQAMRERWRKRALEEYDKNGDGELSEEERQAMRRDRGDRAGERMKELAVKHFDTDSDGEIGEAEREAIDRFGKRWETMGKRLESKYLDYNGDGEVSDSERKASRQHWMVAGATLMSKAKDWLDTNGDGELSPDEHRAFRQRMQDKSFEWFDEFGMRFDDDDDGRLDEKERGAMIDGFEDEIDRRVKAADADGNGILTGAELAALMETWGRDTGVIPGK